MKTSLARRKVIPYLYLACKLDQRLNVSVSQIAWTFRKFDWLVTWFWCCGVHQTSSFLSSFQAIQSMGLQFLWWDQCVPLPWVSPPSSLLCYHCFLLIFTVLFLPISLYLLSTLSLRTQRGWKISLDPQLLVLWQEQWHPHIGLPLAADELCGSVPWDGLG